MENCMYCGEEITSDDQDTWIDNSGGDVCCYRGGKPIMQGNRAIGFVNDVHVPYDPEPPDMSGSGGDDR